MHGGDGGSGIGPLCRLSDEKGFQCKEATSAAGVPLEQFRNWNYFLLLYFLTFDQVCYLCKRTYVFARAQSARPERFELPSSRTASSNTVRRQQSSLYTVFSVWKLLKVRCRPKLLSPDTFVDKGKRPVSTQAPTSRPSSCFRKCRLQFQSA